MFCYTQLCELFSQKRNTSAGIRNTCKTRQVLKRLKVERLKSPAKTSDVTVVFIE